MGTINIKPRGGRKPELTYLNGEIVQVKRLIQIGNSSGIILPKEWLLVVFATKGKEPEKVAIDYNATVLTVRPYFNGEEE